MPYDLSPILTQASLIPERLAGCFTPDETRCNEELVRARLVKWCETAAHGNRKRFEQRLAWDGLDIEAASRVLGFVCLADGQPLPDWVDTLSEALDAARPATRFPGETRLLDDTDPCLDPQSPIPFEEALLPFVHVARHRLMARAGSKYLLLSAATHSVLERYLLRTLSHLGAPCMQSAFAVRRALEQQGYATFVGRLREGGWLSFFTEYSVLARLLAAQTDRWIEATGEFLERLEADWPDMRYSFGAAGGTPHEAPPQPEPVVAVAPGLSDPHRGGRSAMVVEFASGLKLVYKPKDVGAERAFHALLSWCNARGLTPPLKTLKVLNRSTHGWVEFVPHQPCQSQEEARQFYRRAGMLLALLYGLRGIDYHYENCIAHGPHPVPVDHEMLMGPRFGEAYGSSLAGTFGGQPGEHSVLSTGLLPTWQAGPEGQPYDASALWAVPEPGQTVRRWAWQHVNTDAMTQVQESMPVKVLLRANTPEQDGTPVSPLDYVEELVDGFQTMFRFLQEHRAAILAPDGPLAAFRQQPVRFTFRTTRLYLSMLEASLAPKHMHDGADRSIQLDLLSRALLSLDLPSREGGTERHVRDDVALSRLVRAEEQALATMDVPLFTVPADGRALSIAPGESLADFFAESGYDLAVSRLSGLSDEDMQRQVGYIRSALSAWDARWEPGTGGSHPLPTFSKAESLQEARLPSRKLQAFGKVRDITLTPEQMVEKAAAIADTLEAHAVRSAAGPTWLHVAYNTGIQRYQLKPLGNDLYGGVGGVALFLAALSSVTDATRPRDLALAALQPLRQALQSSRGRDHLARMGIGAATGLGSAIYTLARAGQFLGEDTLLVDAREIATLLTAERIASDKSLDVVSGAAGALLGLLALQPVAPASLELALACGRHLLDTRAPGPSGYRAWPTLDGKLLAGFSHGAAGIAYALLRLYAVTGEATFRDAAREGIAYERSIFSVEAANWPDLRAPAGERPTFMTSWCHGAPGIGLARLGGLPHLDTDEIRADVEIALKMTRRTGLQGANHLCCGTLGRAELLLTASSRLARPELLDVARQWASQVVAQLENGDGPGLRPRLSAGVCNPGFFQGLAGIGYELLRLAHPAAAPSILLWE